MDKMNQEAKENKQETSDVSMDFSTKELEEAMCRIMEIAYIEQFGREVGQDNHDLYPMDWHGSQDYNKKLEILKEAVKDRKEIINTESYQSMIESVRKTN